MSSLRLRRAVARAPHGLLVPLIALLLIQPCAAAGTAQAGALTDDKGNTTQTPADAAQSAIDAAQANKQPTAPDSSGAKPASVVPADVENAVVKVFSTLRHPDLFRPWTKQAPSEVSASGVVIEGRRILTNAHVVLYASQVQIQANQAGDKLAASVVAIAPDIDLAVLKLEDESFFDSHAAIRRASALPDIKDAVLAYGFPTGGTALSITKGIVSRIEFVPYNFPASGLRIQIDAAINPGNSGGPAIAGDRMIGLAFSHLDKAQNIGYIIPNEEIDLFLKDIADGHYDGKPAMFDDLQTLENPALRAYLKLDKSVQGIVVHKPDFTNPSDPLKEWDVITKIAETPIDDQGMIKMTSGLRVGFAYRIQQVAKNEKVPLTVVRAGKVLQIEMPVSNTRPRLIKDLNGQYPSYFVYGPLVFSRVTVEFLSFTRTNPGIMTALSLIGSPLVTHLGDPPSPEREELAMVSSPLFPHNLSRGYSNQTGGVVYSVNGVRIRSLRHLVEVLRDLKDEFVVFEFDHRGGEALVLPRKETEAATEEILRDNDVRAQGSADMMKVWNARHGK